MYSALEVADVILKSASRNGDLINPRKLNKLVYITHVWYIMTKLKELYYDKIEIWEYGPIVVPLYYSTRQFRRGNIPHDFYFTGGKTIKECDVLFIEDVYKKYKHLTGDHLAEMAYLICPTELPELHP